MRVIISFVCRSRDNRPRLWIHRALWTPNCTWDIQASYLDLWRSPNSPYFRLSACAGKEFCEDIIVIPIINSYTTLSCLNTRAYTTEWDAGTQRFWTSHWRNFHCGKLPISRKIISDMWPLLLVRVGSADTQVPQSNLSRMQRVAFQPAHRHWRKICFQLWCKARRRSLIFKSIGQAHVRQINLDACLKNQRYKSSRIRTFLSWQSWIPHNWAVI